MNFDAFLKMWSPTATPMWGPWVNSTITMWEPSANSTTTLTVSPEVLSVLPWVVLFLLAYALFATIFGLIAPYFPGLCYLHWFPVRHRFSVALLVGTNPTIGRLKPLVNWKSERRFGYRYTRSGKYCIHIWPSVDGGTPAEIRDALNSDFAVGSDLLFMPMLNMFIYVHRLLRLLLVIAVVSRLSYAHMFAFGAITAGAYYFERLTLAWIGALLYLMVFSSIPWVVFPVVGATWYLLQGWAKRLILTTLKRYWRRKKFDVPSSGFPEGVGPSGRGPHLFAYPGVNPELMQLPYKEDLSLPREARDQFIRATGLTGSSTMESGNPHATAAALARYMRWYIEKIRPKDYLVNIGGTWKGFSCRATGVAIQPCFSEGDASNIMNWPSRPGLGQQVVVDWLATDCGPVGENRPGYDPGLVINGVTGAVGVMQHVYEVPVKALVGFASLNQLREVFVIMHGAPDVFTENEGVLPWSQQRWRHDEKGKTEFYFPGSSSVIYKHSTLLYFEHFTTEYVQTRPGEWWVSQIPRQILDVYLIQWTRTNEKPVPSESRRIRVVLPQQDCVLPIVATALGGKGQEMVTPYHTKKQFEEYTHVSKDFQRMSTNFRALTDNYERNRGLIVPHTDYAHIVGIWNADLIRRRLEELATAEAQAWDGLALVGLAEDTSFVKEMAVEALKLFKRQPKSDVEVKLIHGDDPWLPALGAAAEPVTRIIPLPEVDVGEGGMLTQRALDKVEIREFAAYTCGGENQAERLMVALVGRGHSYGVLMPLGTPSEGGSHLHQDGTGLLPGEALYLMERLGVIFVHTRDARVTWRGRLTGRNMIVHIDEDAGRVHRMHYSRHMPPSRLLRHMGATHVDWSDFGWLPEGTERAYIPHPLIDAASRAVRQTHLRDRIARSNQENVRAELTERAANLGELETIQAMEGMAGMPVYPKEDGLQRYDYEHRVAESGLPPPHAVVNSTELMMELMREVPTIEE